MHALFPLLAFMKSDCYNNRSIWKLQELYFIPTITGDYNNEEINLYQRLITTYSEVIKSKKLINESIKGSKMNYLQDKYKNINYEKKIYIIFITKYY